jgi:hypothetical protein
MNAQVQTPEERAELERRWAEILKGRQFIILVSEEQRQWAGEFAVRCIRCVHAPGERHDPWYGWCLVHRCLVSDTFPKLCPRFQAQS